MRKILSFIGTIGFIFFGIGLFSPAASLFWYQQEPTRLASAIIYGSIMAVSFIAFTFTAGRNKVEKRSLVTAKEFNDAHSEHKEEQPAEAGQKE